MSVEMTEKQVQGNCALGTGCACTKKPKPWLCANWGKSTLSNPNVISAYSQRLG